jgi:basic amino acid/polyamine antiporter, APA family
VPHKHFKTPTPLPVLGALSCGFLVTPFTDRNPAQYAIAGVLLAIGIALWGLNYLAIRAMRAQPLDNGTPAE